MKLPEDKYNYPAYLMIYQCNFYIWYFIWVTPVIVKAPKRNPMSRRATIIMSLLFMSPRFRLRYAAHIPIHRMTRYKMTTTTNPGMFKTISGNLSIDRRTIRDCPVSTDFMLMADCNRLYSRTEQQNATRITIIPYISSVDTWHHKCLIYI